MGKVNVVIVDATGNKEQKVGLPDDIKCGIIMVKLIEKIKLPSVGPDGNPISYKFIHKVTGRQLLETQTMAEAGIKDGDVLRLQPEITAGAACPNCGNVEAEGNLFCSKCGTRISADANPSGAEASAAPAATTAQTQSEPIQNPVAAQAYTTVQYQPGYTQAPVIPKKNIFDMLFDNADKIAKYVGLIGVALYLLANVILKFISYDDIGYKFLHILSNIGYSGILLVVVTYIAIKLKKDK